MFLKDRETITVGIGTSVRLEARRTNFPPVISNARIICAALAFLVAAGCSGGNSSPSESQLQSALEDLAANDAKGLISFDNIQKVDGQLQPDGLNYIMDYEARFTTNKCIEFKTYADGYQIIPFDVLEERSASKQSSWCAQNVGRFLNSGSGRFWGAGYTANIIGQVHFTKKEKGWTVSKALLPLKKMHGSGKLAWRDPVLASQEQLVSGLALAGGTMAAVIDFHQEYNRLPSNNQEAGLAKPDKLRSKFVSSITVRNGVIAILYGNEAEESIFGKTFLYEPKIDDAGKLSWICRSAEIADQYLPEDCR